MGWVCVTGCLCVTGWVVVMGWVGVICVPLCPANLPNAKRITTIESEFYALR